MAEVIVSDNQVSVKQWQLWLRLLGIGAAAGLVYWVLSLLIGRYVVEPLACRDVLEATACVGADSLAGKIGTVLAAVIAIFAMVRLGVIRPIIIAVGAAALLWELAAWLTGLPWYEVLLWSILLYAIAYALFGWIVRAHLAIVAIILAVIVVLAIRIPLALL